MGLTQKELARQVGYALVTLRKVEADELRPSGQMARKLAEALELAPEEQAQFVRFARDEAYWDDLCCQTISSPPLPHYDGASASFSRRHTSTPAWLPLTAPSQKQTCRR